MKYAKWLVVLTSLVVLANQSVFLSENQVGNLRWLCLASFLVFVLWRGKGARFRGLLLADLLALFLISLAASSLLYSAYPVLTAERVLSLFLLYVAAFWAVWEMADREGEEEVLKAILLPLTLAYVACLLVLPFPSISRRADGRFQGILINPNSLGLLVCIFLPLVVWRAAVERTLWRWLLVGVMVGAVLLSGSRNGIMTSLCGVMYLIARSRIRRKSWIIAAMVIALIYASQSQVQDRFAGQSLETGGGRLDIWPLAVDLIQQQPLTGHGFGTEDMIVVGLTGGHLLGFTGTTFHNAYLGMGVQLGFLGLTFFFVPLIVLFFVRAFTLPPTPEDTLGRALEGVLLAGLISATFESWIYSVGNAFSFPFWICVMLLVRRGGRRRAIATSRFGGNAFAARPASIKDPPTRPLPA